MIAYRYPLQFDVHQLLHASLTVLLDQSKPYEEADKGKQAHSEDYEAQHKVLVPVRAPSRPRSVLAILGQLLAHHASI